MQLENKLNKYAIFIIIFIAILLRLLAVLWTYHFHKEGIVFSTDSYVYDKAALSFLKNGFIDLSPSNLHPYIPWTPELGYPIFYTAFAASNSWPPGYPVFLATIYALFGHNFFIINLIQISMTIIIYLLTIDICKKLFDFDSVFIVAILLALDTLLIRSSQYLLSETLFTLFLVIGVWIAVYGLISRKWSYMNSFILGLCISLATMVRPIAYYLIIPIVFCCLYQFRSLLYSWKKSFTLILILLLPWLGIIGGWQIRNYITTGISDFCTTKSFALFYYTGATILAEKENITFQEAQEKISLSILPDANNISQNDLVKLHTKIGVDLIIKNPIIFSKNVLKSLLATLLGPGFSQFDKWIPNKLMAYSVMAISMIVLLFSYLGILLWLVNIKKDPSYLMLPNMTIWVIIVYLLLVGAGGPSYSRFRIPLMPFIALYGGHGIAIAYRKYFKGK